jgi:hypothetical protein
VHAHTLANAKIYAKMNKKQPEKEKKIYSGTVLHTCNLSYLRSTDWEDQFKTSWV